jgi:electron transport complex, RnfABCDGE type, G subunit
MAALKSSLLNMFLSLTMICVVSGGLLAFVNDLTSEPIRAAKNQKLEDAIKKVVPGFDNAPAKEAYWAAISEGDSLKIYPARKGEELIGVAVESNSMKGFSGEIKIMVGLTPSGEVTDYVVLQHAETPGLGDKMDPWFKTDKNKQTILGKKLAESSLKVSKDGGDVDAITAATITSRAFLDAVNRAYAAFAGKIDGTSSATSADGTSAATGKDSPEKVVSEPDADSGATVSQTDTIKKEEIKKVEPVKDRPTKKEPEKKAVDTTSGATGSGNDGASEATTPTKETEKSKEETDGMTEATPQ